MKKALITGITGQDGSYLAEPKKLLDVSRLKSLGWKQKVSLKDGIKLTYDWYKRR